MKVFTYECADSVRAPLLHAELGFRQIEPTAVLWREVPFEALDQALASAAGKAW